MGEKICKKCKNYHYGDASCRIEPRYITRQPDDWCSKFKFPNPTKLQLKKELRDLDISPRTRKICANAGFKTVGDLYFSGIDLIKDRTARWEVLEILEELNIGL